MNFLKIALSNGLKNNSFNSWQNTQKSEFNTWITTLEDVLDENVAATLVNTVMYGYRAGRVDE